MCFSIKRDLSGNISLKSLFGVILSDSYCTRIFEAIKIVKIV